MWHLQDDASFCWSHVSGSNAIDEVEAGAENSQAHVFIRVE